MTKFAMVFPGQGSQSVGMLSTLAKEYQVIESTFAEASEVLGYDLWALVQQGPADELNKTSFTQPALLAASVALWRIWQEKQGTKPDYMAGHSLGEYSALVCASVLDFQTAIKLVELRGKLMQEAVPEGIGAMSAIIGLDNEAIINACEQASQGEVVSPVNFNSPGQVVIAGIASAVNRANELCKAAGARMALPIPISVPSHCILMKPAAEKLADALNNITFHTPKISVINNVDVKIESIPDSIRDALVRQLYSPVRWVEIIEYMTKQGISELFEVGPGKVLTGLTKRINSSLTATAINDVATFDKLFNK